MLLELPLAKRGLVYAVDIQTEMLNQTLLEKKKTK